MKRPTSPAPSTEFGLIAWLESTRIALPLKGVECRFEINGALASVELDQIYHQNAGRPLDCTYTFPLPAGAAVYRCELHVNGRVIRAKVEEQEAARRIFREQKAAGRRAALVEAERPNLFTLSLGNVQPDDVIVVRFAWFSVLDRTGDGLRLLVPTCPGVRYIPGQPLLRTSSGRGTVDDTDQVPDASRITPPRIDALHPDAAYFSIDGRLSATDLESGSVSSPSHALYVREIEGVVSVALSGHGAVPDRDFVLAWREAKAAQLSPRSWVWMGQDGHYALVQLRAPANVAVAEGFSQDVYFLVDRSGSMAGAKWQRTCQALRAFVALLGAEDRVWITAFETSYRDFAEAPQSAPAILADRNFQGLEALGTGGGTELLPAARHVLEKIATHSADRRASVILITDGQVGNESEVVRAFQQAPRVSVHVFGIDTTVNDAFLKSLARQHRGGCWLCTPDDDIAGTISALGDRLRRPVLTDLSVSTGWESGGDALPDLHAGAVVAVGLRGNAANPLEINGRLPNGNGHRIGIHLDATGSEAIRLLWAQERISAFLAANRQSEAIGLARHFNLICQGAAFIAWDEAEQVPIATEQIVQPALEGYRDSLRTFSAAAMYECMDSAAEDDTCYAEAPAPASAPAAMANLLATISERACRELAQAGIPQEKAAALVKWALNEDGVVATGWVPRLEGAASHIVLLRSELNAPYLRRLVEPEIERVLNGSPEALLAWAENAKSPFGRIFELRMELEDTGAPREVIDRLCAWVLEVEAERSERLERLQNFLIALPRNALPSNAVALRWRAFLEANVGVDSETFAVASGWLLGMRDPRPTPPTGATA